MQLSTITRNITNYLSLESRSLYLDDTVVHAVERVVAKNPKTWTPYPALIYLADTLRVGDNEVPYALVAGADAIPDTSTDSLKQKENEILLTSYPQAPLSAARGDDVHLIYYLPDEKDSLMKKELKLICHGTVPLAGGFDDPDLTPNFPGITDKQDMASWENPPFPYDSRRIKPRDEDFWKRYRTTPRGFVTLATAQKLWGGRFGNVTSYRLVSSNRDDPERDAQDFRSQLLQELKPELGGFTFQNLRAQALASGAGATDFSGLFLGFSSFLIVSSLMLVGLLVRLSIARRASELGLLLALGWSYRKVRRLLMCEGLVVTMLGALAGLAAALLYADLLLRWLRYSWPTTGGLPFLTLHTSPFSFAVGYVATVTIAALTLLWALVILSHISPRALLSGISEQPVVVSRSRSLRNVFLLWGGAVGAVACIAAGYFATGAEAKAGSFFGAGALALTSMLSGVSRLLAKTPSARTLTLMGIGNAGRFRLRSLLTVGLLALAVFLIVAVELFHKDPGTATIDPHSGNGGFAYYAESDVPIFEPLDFSFRLRAGDDTSCLNLYQPLKPRILGVPRALFAAPRFHFAAGLWQTAAEEENPWLLLNRAQPDGSIPLIADANTANYILKVPLGGYFDMPDENGKIAKLRIVAILEDSIFQSELLMGDRQFLSQFPHEEGFRFFLKDGLTKNATDPVTPVSIGGQNLIFHPTADRLQAYFGVENTYLATFQALGALGLLLGTLGLAIVLVRGVWERRAEFALLQAVGFRRSAIAWLIFAENFTLFVLGISTGVSAAVVAVAPNLVLSTGVSAIGRLLFFLLILGTVGLLSGGLGVFFSLRTPILTALRRE